MDKQIEVRKLIERRVKEFGIGELNNQRKTIQDQLVKIEEYFQTILSEQKKVKDKTKELAKVNLSTVSSGTHIQRSTIYSNKNTLQVYIEKRIEEVKKEDILEINATNKMKNKNDDMIQLVEGLKQQVVDNFELSLQIQDLENELKLLHSQREDDQKRIFLLEQENFKLQRQLSKINKDKVIPFKK